jgi:mRNA interferase RelE/StbE
LSDRWEVVWSQTALKAMRKFDKPTRERIVKAAHLLSRNPHPPASKPLVGTAGTFRIRTGDWRLLYVVRDRELIVLIVKGGHRSDIYKRL